MTARSRFAVWLAVIVVPMAVVMAGLVAFIAREHRESVDLRHIARTLNHETWVGTRPHGTMRPAWRETPEAANRGKGLEGQAFHSAYSRSPRTGWTVATGIPADVADEGHARKLFIAGGGTIVAIGLTVLLALRLGSRI